jgi:D-threo-aldose 1-dehydrogenase
MVREMLGGRTVTLETRDVGRTDLKVSILGFGSAPLGDLFARLDEAQAVETVVAAGEAGVNLFDTSPHYGNGLAEHRFGAAFRRMKGEPIVATKVGRLMTPAAKGAFRANNFVGSLSFNAAFDYSYDGAMRSFEHSLLRLARPTIDILLIHDVDVWTHGEAFEQRYKEAMNGAYKALAKLRDEGAVRAIGCGLNEADKCERFARDGDFDCMLLAGRYTLLEQGALDTFLPLAVKKNMSILKGGVFNSGVLATGAVAGAKYNYKDAPPEILGRTRRIEAVCTAHGVPLAHAAMQFPLAHPAIASVVLGAVTAAEVKRNVEGLSREIPAGLWSDLKSAGLIRPDAPIPGEAP